MTMRPDGRRLLQITMSPLMYVRLKAFCLERDLPLSVWGRAVIERALEERWIPRA